MKALSQLVLLSFLLFFDSCDPFESVSKEELPPATQEGKNTFGCLVNGKIWLPQGKVGSTTNLDMHYDPSFQNGAFNLAAYRVNNKSDQAIGLFSDSLKSTGLYLLNDPTKHALVFDDAKTQCAFYTETNILRSGELIITKFDLSNRIISGTCHSTLFKQNCDTIRITEGRFDMKI